MAIKPGAKAFHQTARAILSNNINEDTIESAVFGTRTTALHPSLDHIKGAGFLLLLFFLFYKDKTKQGKNKNKVKVNKVKLKRERIQTKKRLNKRKTRTQTRTRQDTRHIIDILLHGQRKEQNKIQGRLRQVQVLLLLLLLPYTKTRKNKTDRQDMKESNTK